MKEEKKLKENGLHTVNGRAFRQQEFEKINKNFDILAERIDGGDTPDVSFSAKFNDDVKVENVEWGSKVDAIYWDKSPEAEKTSQYTRTPSGNIKLTTHQVKVKDGVKRETQIVVSATKITITKFEDGNEIKSVDIFDLLDRVEALESK